MSTGRSLAALAGLCLCLGCGTGAPRWWGAAVTVEDLDPSGVLEVSEPDREGASESLAAAAGDPALAEDAPAAADSALAEEAPTAETDEEEPEAREFFIAPMPSHDSSFGWGVAIAGGMIFRVDPEDPETPPSTLAVAGFGSENDSWAAVLSSNLHLAGDRWRVRASAGTATVYYEFYGIGAGAGIRGISVPFRTEYRGAKLDLLRRVAWDPLGRLGEGLYLGVLAELSTLETNLESQRPLPSRLSPDVFDTTRAILGLRLERDTRDDRFFPREGSLFNARFEFSNEAWGSDEDYQRLDLEHRSYHSLDPLTVFAWRAYLRSADGDVPFYDLYAHDLRGYENGRYRDEATVAGELELRRRLLSRLHVVAFTGLGQVAAGVGRLSSDKLLWSAGAGVRFQLTQSSELHYAIDGAWGRDGFEFYFSLGQAF
jgi:hypothetical protein